MLGLVDAMKTAIVRAGFAGSLLLLIFSVSRAVADVAQPGPTFTVNTLADHDDGVCGSSDCSLREALNAANAAVGANTIKFAANVTGTITLTLGELQITDAVTITGPGARVLSVDANLASRVLTIASTSQGTPVAISGLTLTRGQATGSGGGILSSSSVVVTLTNCTISDCSAVGFASQSAADPGSGGGVYNGFGKMTFIGCTFRGNSAIGGSIPSRGSNAVPGGGADGGAIYNLGALTLQNCTLTANTAQGGRGGNALTGGQGGAGGHASGGAIINFTNGTLTTLNCTMSGNFAIGGDGGFGAPTGAKGFGTAGGIYRVPNAGPSEFTGNTLIAANTASTEANDVFGGFTSQGFNLVGEVDVSGNGFNSTDKKGTQPQPLDPKISSLANNGGPTDTMALLAGSPAINSANTANAPARDQRNYVRPDAPDIGAFEFGGTIPVTLANISTRLAVQTGDNVLIGGFIITGTQQKKVILRAIGPSLNLLGKLSDPTLELYQGNTLLESNDNWVDSTNKQAIIDSTIPPSNNLESAIVRSLAPGPYTAIVRGVNNGTGIGVVEAYDLDRTVDSKLANISTRGPVQIGDNVLFGGFIVVGPDSQKVIIRALGPSTGLPGAIADPTLELHDSNGGLLEANDNWVDSPNKQAIIDSTIPPTNNLESAIVRTLTPANYTAIVRGANNTTGIAVVEVYALN